MKGTYRSEAALESDVTQVDTEDGRHFLVVRYRTPGAWKTLVFQRETQPDCWVSRREIFMNMEPVLAVTGLLLSPAQGSDPMGALKRDLDRARKAYWKISKLKVRGGAVTSGRGEKRGKHVGGNP